MQSNEVETTEQREQAAEQMWKSIDYRGFPAVIPASRNELHKIADKPWLREEDSKSAIDLLEKGENLHRQDSQRKTPLCLATYNGHLDLTLIFLSWGAKVNVKDVASYTPKFYKMNYTCDHEYDEGGCIPLKRYMNKPQRELLANLEILEKKYMTEGNPYFNFNDIDGQFKNQIVALLKKEDFNNPKVRNAICGYVVNNLPENQRKEAFDFFVDHYKKTYGHELKREDVYRSLPGQYFTNTASHGLH